MFTRQRPFTLTPDKTTVAAGAQLGNRYQITLDRTWPIERIKITVSFVVSTQLTLATSPQTQAAYDNILGIVDRINLSVREGGNPRTVVDCRGAELLEYNMLSGGQLDPGTLWLIQQSQGSTLAVGAYRIVYTIPCAALRMNDPLRSRTYLPVHKMNQDPVLTLSFQTLATMASAGAINNIFVDVTPVTREVTDASEAKLVSSAIPGGHKDFAGKDTGYINWDLVAQPFNIPTGVTTEQRFALSLSGEYTELCFMQYLGGANLARNVIDSAGIGDTVAHGFGAENLWRIETAKTPIRNWKWRDLQADNALMQERNNITQSSSPFFGGAVLSATNFQAASSTMIDFLGDGQQDTDNNELGSLLDANLADTLKLEVVGTPANTATNGSILTILGRKLYGDLSRYQVVQ